MVDVAEMLQRYLGVPTYLLRWPNIITELLIPFILFAYAMKLILEKLSIFRNETVNSGLAIVISLSSILFVRLMITPVSVFMITMLKVDGNRGVALGFILAAITGFVVMPWLTQYLSLII